MDIITHNGRFHTDEVYACALLSYLYKINSIVRTRNTDCINLAERNETTFIVDVGQKYDHDNLLYDHHQSSFKDTFSDKHDINLSSCGLIWRHYGIAIIDKYIKQNCSNDEIELLEQDKDRLHSDFYQKNILCIDANDNGVKRIKNPNKIKYRFYHEHNLFTIIGQFNSIDVDNDEIQDQQFKKAMQHCLEYFLNSMNHFIKYKLDYNKNLSVFKGGFDVVTRNKNRKYIYLDSDINANSYLNNYDPKQQIKFIISWNNKNKQYKVYARKKKPDSFDVLVPLISQSDAQKILLSNNISEEDCTFIHSKRFLGVFKTYEAAQLVVKQSLKEHKNNKIKRKIKIGLGIASITGLISASVYFFAKFKK